MVNLRVFFNFIVNNFLYMELIDIKLKLYFKKFDLLFLNKKLDVILKFVEKKKKVLFFLVLIYKV